MLSQGLQIKTAYPIKILNQINITNIYNWVYVCNVKCRASINYDNFETFKFHLKMLFLLSSYDHWFILSKWTRRAKQCREEHNYSKISRPTHKGFICAVCFQDASLKSKSSLVLKSNQRSSRINSIKLVHLQHFTQDLLVDSNKPITVFFLLQIVRIISFLIRTNLPQWWPKKR